MALLELEADECPGCGWDRATSMNADSEFAFAAEPVRCHACAARDRADRAARADGGWDDAGIAWTTNRKGVSGG